MEKAAFGDLEDGSWDQCSRLTAHFDTANISKFSDPENASKNLENMCNYASIFLILEMEEKNEICSKKFSSKKS